MLILFVLNMMAVHNLILKKTPWKYFVSVELKAVFMHNFLDMS
jgi:hypothetical protein